MLCSVKTKQFEKDVKRLQKSGRYDLKKLKEVMQLLINGQQLPAKYHNHKLKEYENRWDCHIQGDWILFYEIDKTTNTIYFVRTGTHSELFG